MYCRRLPNRVWSSLKSSKFSGYKNTGFQFEMYLNCNFIIRECFCNLIFCYFLSYSRPGWSVSFVVSFFCSILDYHIRFNMIEIKFLHIDVIISECFCNLISWLGNLIKQERYFVGSCFYFAFCSFSIQRSNWIIKIMKEIIANYVGNYILAWMTWHIYLCNFWAAHFHAF